METECRHCNLIVHLDDQGHGECENCHAQFDLVGDKIQSKGGAFRFFNFMEYLAIVTMLYTIFDTRTRWIVLGIFLLITITWVRAAFYGVFDCRMLPMRQAFFPLNKQQAPGAVSMLTWITAICWVFALLALILATA